MLAIVEMMKYLTKAMNWYFNFVGFSLAFAKKKKKYIYIKKEKEIGK